jgi:hypothetical protein
MEVHYVSLAPRRAKSASGSNRGLHLPKVSTAEIATQRLDELPPLAGGFGRAFYTKHKKYKEWDLNGHAEWKDVDIVVPMDRFERNHKPPAGFRLDPIGRKRSDSDPIVRSGFHRLVYQKARYLREEHGNGYTGFAQVGRDMVRSVKVCMQVTEIGRNLKKLVTDPVGDECENDVGVQLDGANVEELPPNRDSVDKHGHEDHSAEAKLADDRWKSLLADVKMQGLIISFLD